MKGTCFVFQLPRKTQELIRMDLESESLSKVDIERGMNSRLIDLEDTINIKKYL